MEPFATVEDLKAGGKCSGVSDEVAEVLLVRASANLQALLDRHGVKVDHDDEVQAVNLTAVVCNMVARSLAQQDADALASVAQSIGSTNVSVTYRDPGGSFYISRADKELLGISGRGGFRMLRTAIRNPDGTPAEGW